MTFAEFNHLEKEVKRELLYQCCGSKTWVDKMLNGPPAESLAGLLEDAEKNWYECDEKDWKEAFAHHPKIGDIASLRKKFSSDAFAGGEQASVNSASEQTLEALAEGNHLYEQKFGYIFIVCATGKSAPEMLALLTTRLQNNPEQEIKIAMKEQKEITKIRLLKIVNQ